MKLGFTGTQHGMTDVQRRAAVRLLYWTDVESLHHGDCIGADMEIHGLALPLCIPIVVHPPTDNSRRMFAHENTFVSVMPQQPYLRRNRDIVDATDHLLACPGQDREILRSGTWATVRYARKLHRPITIIYPDGRGERVQNYSITETQARQALAILKEVGLWVYDRDMADYFVRYCQEEDSRHRGIEFRLFMTSGVKFKTRWDYLRQGIKMYVDCYPEEQRHTGLQEKITKANLRLDVLTAPVTE